MKLILYDDLWGVSVKIKGCQRKKHIQQVAYSTYHDCLTQICFTCNIVRTSISKEDLNGKK